MLTLDDTGAEEYALAYTAFGQPVLPDGAGGWTIGWPPAPGDVPTRYQYAGGWGYESGPWGEEVGGVSSDGGLVLYGANTDLPPITLLHVGERWYQPDIGRFVQRDPIGLKGGLNVYAYVENDPLASSDSSGLGNFGSLEAWATYRGLRESGKSAEQASEIMRNSAKDEVVIAGAWCVVGYAGLLAGTLVGPLLPVGAAKAAETYELIIVRTTPGADGAISMIVKTIDVATGRTIKVVHRVVDAIGNVIHEHIKFP